MPVIGVLTCEILELEIAYLLANDKSISTIFVITNEAGKGVISALENRGVNTLKSIKSIDAFCPSRGGKIDILVQVLEIGLHCNKSKLQQAIVMESRNLGAYADALFLGYGLCGNALDDPDELLSHLNIPYFLPQDGDHPVDDCVGLFIGGRDNYYAEQLKEAGTFFMTAGWTNHWRDIFSKEFGNVSIDMAKRIFKHYKRALLISNPVMKESQMEENIREFNTLFNCCSDFKKGSMDMLSNTWQAAKTYVLKQQNMSM